MAKYSLFIDESGNAGPIYLPDRPYILVGCAIDGEKRASLEQKANALKMKYWRKTNVVLHHVDLKDSKGVFSILAGDVAKQEAFKKDLLQYLHSAPVNVFVSVVNKQKVTPSWTINTVVKKTARSIFADYIAFLYTRKSPRGDIIIEASDSLKDKEYLDAFRYFLSPDCKDLDTDFSVRNIRDVITSITFVTKQNNDNETQVADILGYAASCKYKRDTLGETIAEGSYEADLIKVLEAKIFAPYPAMGPSKMIFANKVNGYKIIP